MPLAAGSWRAETLRKSVVAAVVALASMTLAVAAPADARSIVVTSTADDGPGSLRAAIDESRGSGEPDVITFDLANGDDTITLDTSLPAFGSGVTLTGPGSDQLTISIAQFRIFWTQHDLTMTGLTLTGGAAVDGGALYSTGADLVLDDVVFRGNRALRSGGAVYVTGGTATITNSVFDDNEAVRNGTAIFAGPVDGPTDISISTTEITGNRLLTDRAGTAIDHRAGQLSVDSSLITGNLGYAGAAITATDATTISRTSIIDNTSTTGGAAITNYGDLTLDEVTIQGNVATGTSPGPQVTHVSGELTVLNSTFVGDGLGAALLSAGETFQLIRVTNSTFNRGPVEFTETLGGPVNVALSTFVDAPIDIATTTTAPNFEEPRVSVTHSILAQHDAANEPISSGVFESIDHTLLQDSSSVQAIQSDANIVDTDPFLAPLADNGGLTETFLPSADSPVRNAGVLTFTQTPPTDQRGTERIQNGVVDLGSVENGFYTEADFVVTSTANAGVGTLRSAIFATEATAGANTISFDLDAGDDEIELITSLPQIDDETAIVGPGAEALDLVADRQRVFYARAPLTVTGMSISGGGGTRGGAIWADRTDLVVDDVIFRDNSASESGGAIHADGDTLTISNSLFDLNSTFRDGAAIFAGPVGRPTDVSITDSRIIRSNVADLRPGAAVQVEAGSLAITDSMVSDNRGDEAAGIRSSAPTSLLRVEVSRNVSQRGGTGIATSSSLTMDAVTVARNDTAGSSRGGQVVHADGALDIRNSTFQGDGIDDTNASSDPMLSVSSLADVLDVSILNSTFSDGSISMGTSTSTAVAHSTFVDTSVELRTAFAGTGDATMTLDHTIVSGAAWNPGGITSVTSSLIETDPGYAGIDAATLIDVDALLGPLRDNGGPTQTHMPTPESPAIDAGAPSAPDFPALDQRGFPRVQQTGIDIGATETSLPAFQRAVFEPIVPARLADSRATGVTIDGDEQRFGPITRRSIPITGRAAISPTATAIVVNATALRPSADGWLAVVPCEVEQPTTASLNFVADITISSEIIAPLSADGSLCVDSTVETDIILDVVGYTEATSGIMITAPTRLEDTRPNSSVDATGRSTGSRLGPGGRLDFAAAGRAGVPADAKAIVVNVTAVRPDALGYLTAHPCLDVAPVTASVNFVAGVNRGNELVVGLDDEGRACIDSNAGVDVTIDLVGWVGPDAAYETQTPERLLDTRSGSRLDAGETVVLPVAGFGGVPTEATLATVNVTAVRASDAGFFTIRNCDEQTSLAASLTYSPDITAGNEVITAIGSAGNICIFTSAATHLTVDVAGYAW